MKTLECSSKGDKRFSALYAKITVNGKLTTIEKAYQQSKVYFIDREYVHAKDFKQAKHWQYQGHKSVEFSVGNKIFAVKYLSSWYKALWYKYLTDNECLIDIINQYDNFHDCFKNANTINCQADIIQQVKDKGINSLYEDIKEFIDLFY